MQSDLQAIIESSPKPSVIMAVGAAASGKTTTLEPMCVDCDIVRLSPSEIRAQMKLNENDPKSSLKAWGELHRRVIEQLEEGNSVVIDAKNTESWRRPREVQFYKDHGAKMVVAALFKTPLEELINRNKNRPPEQRDPIDEITASFRALNNNPPNTDEGFNSIVEIQ